MAVSFVAKQEVIAASNSVIVPVPTGKVRDLLVAVVANRNTATPTVHAHWVQQAQIGIGASNSSAKLTIYTRDVIGNEPNSYTFATSSGLVKASIVRYRGVSPTSPINAQGTTAGGFIAPSITTTVANTILLAIIGNHNNDALGAHTITVPGGYTERQNSSIDAAYMASAVAEKLQASAGSSGTATFTTTGGGNTGVAQLALTPNLAVDSPPVAVTSATPAGGVIGRTVTLDGSLSNDAEDTLGAADIYQVLTYAWTQVSGPTVTVMEANRQRAAFRPTVSGSYVFRLIVTDAANQASSASNVTVTVTDSDIAKRRGAGGWDGSMARVRQTITRPGEGDTLDMWKPIYHGWPDSTNTGVPTGTTLTTVGSMVSEYDGQIFDSLNITGTVGISHAGCVIRRCRIQSMVDLGTGSALRRTLIEDCTVAPPDAQWLNEDGSIRGEGIGSDYGIRGSNYVARRNNVYGFGDAFKALNPGNVDIYDNWCHDLFASWTGPDATSLTGTVSKNSSSTTITGSGTSFLTASLVDYYIYIPGGGGNDILLVTSVESNTSLTVSAAPQFTASGQAAQRYAYASHHSDPIQTSGGATFNFVHNTLNAACWRMTYADFKANNRQELGPWSLYYLPAASAQGIIASYYPETNPPPTDVLIEDNLFISAGADLILLATGNPAIVRGNRFGRTIWPRCSWARLCLYQLSTPPVWEDNVWHDTGEVITFGSGGSQYFFGV